MIQPRDVHAFLVPLPVGRIPGVGRVTETRLKELRVVTVGDLAALPLSTLEGQFGRYGKRLYDLARGSDDSPVIANRPVKSISAEDTFVHDLSLSETDDLLRRLAEKVWHSGWQTSSSGADSRAQVENERLHCSHAESHSCFTSRLV